MNDNVLIEFTYHPNLYSNDIVKYEEGICQCCGKKVNIFINFMYAEEDVSCICLECVQNGKAAKKFKTRLIIVVIIFILPSLVNMTIQIFLGSNNSYTNCIYD